MFAQLFLLLEDHFLLAGLEFRPVDLAVLQIVQIDAGNGRVLVKQRHFGVVAPVAGGGNDDAAGKGFFARGGKEAVDVGFDDAMIFCVELALDGVEFVGALGLGDQIDAGVFGVEAQVGVGFYPVGIGPYMAIKVAVGGFVAQVLDAQLFKVGAFLALGNGGVAEGGEKGLQSGHGLKLPW